MPARPTTARPVARLHVERLEERTAPANLQLTSAFTVDGTNAPQANPVYGQNVSVRAQWSSQSMTGAEPACTVRYTVNGIPADSDPVSHGSGSGSWTRSRGGWYVGTSAVSVTVTVDPDNLIAESNEADNSITFNVTPIAPGDLPSKFLTPIGLTPNQDWAIGNYADVDPRSGTAADYRGGIYQYDGHNAIDAGPWGFNSQDSGVPILAAADGTVTQVQDGYFDRQTSMGAQPGNYVQITHGNGWQTLYYHFAESTITVRVGDQVRAGQLLGLMGSSGSSTACHLHYTAYYRGAPVEAGFSPSSYWVSPLPYSGDVPAFTYAAGIANRVPTADGWEGIPAVGTFPATGGASTLYFWVQTFNLKTTDVLTAKWYRPAGTLFSSSNFIPTQNYRNSWWYWTSPLSTFQSLPGTWQMAFEINGVEAERTPFTVAASGAASIRLSDSLDKIILDGRTTPIDFASVAQGGSAPQLSFTVLNHGYANLTLSNLALPPGFSLVSAPASVAAGATGTVTVCLDTAVVGAKFGTLRFDTNDPDVGAFEFALEGTVTGTAPAGAPVIDPDGNPGLVVSPATTYNYLSLPRPLSPSATVTDSNSPNFNGGTLTVEYASFGSSSDRLAVRNQGTGAGQIGVSGASVTYGGATIGTFAGGTGTTPLVVALNSNATVAATQALLRNVTYQNVGGPTTQRKGVRYTLNDGTGGVSNLAVQHVSNSGAARNPTVAALQARGVVRGTTLSYTGSFADPNAFGWTATVDYGDGSGAQPLTLNPDKTFTLSRLYTVAPGSYTVTVTVVSDIGGNHSVTMPVTVVAPVGVASVSANGGAVQRSRVTEITVTFTGLVSLPPTPANGFQLTGPGGDVALTVDTTGSTGTQTVARLRFLGAGSEFTSLADGLYTLRVKGAQILDGSGAAIDGDGDGLAGGDRLSGLYRLFGDIDGNGVVNSDDFDQFGNTFGLGVGDPGYLVGFDFDNNGVINSDDFDQFGNRFGIAL